MDRGYLANGALKQWDMRANYLKFYTQCEANPIACTTSLQHPRCSYFKLSIGDVRHRRGRSQRGRRLGFLDGLGPFSVFFVGGLFWVAEGARSLLSLLILSVVPLNPVSFLSFFSASPVSACFLRNNSLERKLAFASRSRRAKKLRGLGPSFNRVSVGVYSFSGFGQGCLL